MHAPTPGETTPGRPEFRPVRWPFPLAVICVSGLLALFGDAGRLALRYDRQGLAAGELWRVATGHLVHLNLQHFALNVLGLALVWLLVGDALGLRRGFGVLLIVAILISAAFWWLSPDLAWYVGLSGALHGLLFSGLVIGARYRPVESTVIAVLVAAKLAYEQAAGPLPGSVAAAGGPVVVDAHLYGAIAGIMAALPIMIRARASGTL